MTISQQEDSALQEVCLREPAFSDEDVVVVMSTNEAYIPYVSCVLQSILENSSTERNYDIIILSHSISKESQETLIEQMKPSNFSLRFFDLKPFLKQLEGLYVHGHLKIETYFRLLIPDILPWCKKVVYLDADLVVLRDIAELFDTDVEGKLLAAAKDADTAGQYNGFDPTAKNYIDNVLKIKNPYDYFQAGVLVMNLDEFRTSYSCEYMLEYAASYQWNLLDQDVLNNLAQGRVRFIDMAWNTIVDWQELRRVHIIGLAPQHLRDEYEKARLDPYIVHYAGPGNKPWDCVQVDMGEYFWRYADNCPYAEKIRGHLKAFRNSFEGRRIEILDYWVYRVVLRAAAVVAPPNSALRSFVYRIYCKFGGSSW